MTLRDALTLPERGMVTDAICSKRAMSMRLEQTPEPSAGESDTCPYAGVLRPPPPLLPALAGWIVALAASRSANTRS